VELLERAYDANPYPDQNEKEQIAMRTGLNENKVQVWFSNRRARQRKTLTNNIVYNPEVRTERSFVLECLEPDGSYSSAVPAKRPATRNLAAATANRL
jgi:hypothetical protein